MTNRFWQGLLLALVVTCAFAKTPAEIPEQAELSMLVTGSIVVDPDGNVSGWELNQRDKLPDFVVNLIEKSVPAWKFEPVLVDGVPSKAKARMGLRIVANRLADGAGYGIAIRSGHFGEDAMTPGERRNRRSTDDIVSIDMAPPSYPRNAIASGVQGTAYVVIKVNRSGTVENVMVEQVNLRTLGAEHEMKRMRETLARPALVAARRWTFRVPTTGPDADNEYWSIRVPVDFVLSGNDGRMPEALRYGQWEAYIPGPRTKVSWKTEGAGDDESPEAMVAGRLYPAGKGLKLLTPLQQG